MQNTNRRNKSYSVHYTHRCMAALKNPYTNNEMLRFATRGKEKSSNSVISLQLE